MDFLNSYEFQLSLLIEAGLLLLAAIGVIAYLLHRLYRLSNALDVSAASSGPSLLEHLRAEVDRTRDKQARVGSNGEEAAQLRAACALRLQVLAGEIHLLEETPDEETHYWRPVVEYYEAVRGEFKQQIATLEERLDANLQRINNLEKFKEKLFDLRERLNHSYENNCRLEKELREKIKQGAKLSELEHTLSQMEREKGVLQKELQLAEHEFMVIMENAATGAGKITQVELDAETNKELKERIQNMEEENQLLCDQIQALIQNNQSAEQQDANQKALQKRLVQKEHDLLELEKRYARMEEHYLQLQEELDQRQ